MKNLAMSNFKLAKIMRVLHSVFVAITVCLVILNPDYAMAAGGLHRTTTLAQSLGYLMRPFAVIIVFVIVSIIAYKIMACGESLFECKKYFLSLGIVIIVGELLRYLLLLSST